MKISFAAKLSDLIVSLESGSRPKGGASKTSGSIPSLGAEHLDGFGGFLLHEPKLIPLEHFDRMPSGKINQDDILIVKDGATTGKVSFVDQNFPFERAAINEHVFRLALDQSLAIPKYVFWYLNSPQGQRQIMNDFRGATVGGIGRTFTGKVELPLPSIDEQRRIAAILDKADTLRQKRNRAIALLDSLTQSIFLEMFGDAIANPLGRKSKPLRALVDQSRDISYGVVQRGPDQDSGVAVVRISDFGSGKLTTDNLKRTTQEVSAKYPRTVLRGDEIVISIRGTVGRCAIVPASAAGANVSREVAVIPTIDPSLNGFYLALLRSAPVQKAITDDVKGVAQSGINLEDLRQLPVIQPNPDDLERFNNANSIFERLAQQAQSASNLSEKVFASLQHRAFTGQL